MVNSMSLFKSASKSWKELLEGKSMFDSTYDDWIYETQETTISDTGRGLSDHALHEIKKLKAEVQKLLATVEDKEAYTRQLEQELSMLRVEYDNFKKAVIDEAKQKEQQKTQGLRDWLDIDAN